MVCQKLEMAISSFPLKGSEMRGGLHANDVTSRCAMEAEATAFVSPCALMNSLAQLCSFHFLGDFSTKRGHDYNSIVHLHKPSRCG